MWHKVPEGVIFAFIEVNGQTAVTAAVAGTVLAVVALEFDGALIADVRIVANPAKLSRFAGVAGSKLV